MQLGDFIAADYDNVYGFMGDNFSVVDRTAIFNDANKWLNSLPMTEYAHVLTVMTAHNLGGDPRKYVKILYAYMLTPILRRYYSYLEEKRMEANIEYKKYFSTYSIAPREGRIKIKENIGWCTAKVRAMLREICTQYQYFCNYELTSDKVKAIISEINILAEQDDITNWVTQLQTIMAKIQDQDFATSLAALPTTATDAQVIAKVNELCPLFGVTKLADDPYFTDVSAKVNVLINKLNIEAMDGTNSYAKLTLKVNEVIAKINNMKTRQLT